LRGDIPIEIRELWGEHKEAGINFAKTYTAMAAYLANHEFLTGVLDDGLDKGYLWKQGVSTTPRPLNFVPLFGEGSKSMGPLDGTYGLPEVRDAFTDLDQKAQSEAIASLAGLTLLAMKAKTVYSVRAIVRNYFGNVMFLIANGHFGAIAHAITTPSKFLGVQLGVIAAMPVKEKQAYIEHLIEIGVLDDNARLESIRELQKISGTPKPFGFDITEKVPEVARNTIKKIDELATKAYGGVDNIWKIYAYEKELSRLKKAMPAGNIAEMEGMAAHIVRKTLPTYSETSKVVRQAFKGPLGVMIAPFITFTAEVIRVSGGTLHQIGIELKSDNPEIRKIGVKRAFGVVAAVGLMASVTAISKSLFDYDDEDEEAIREALPEWQKNATLIFLRRDAQGNPRYWDVSYLNPYNYFSDAVTAMLGSYSRGDGTLQTAWAGANELLKPFYAEQLFIGAYNAIRHNQTSFGSKIYNEKDTIQDKALKMIGYVVHQTIWPGTAKSLEDIWKASMGHVEASGKKRDVGEELTSLFLGQRIDTLDVAQSLKFQLAKFSRDRQNSAQLFSSIYGTEGSLSDGDVRGAYTRANKAEQDDIQQLRQFLKGAEKLGLTRPQVNQILSSGRVGHNAVSQARRGVYQKYMPGTSLLRDIQKTHPERYREFLQAYGQTPPMVKLN
jgi:hypothetical protein